jgi:hypothetical protein
MTNMLTDMQKRIQDASCKCHARGGLCEQFNNFKDMQEEKNDSLTRDDQQQRTQLQQLNLNLQNRLNQLQNEFNQSLENFRCKCGDENGLHEQFDKFKRYQVEVNKETRLFRSQTDGTLSNLSTMYQAWLNGTIVDPTQSAQESAFVNSYYTLFMGVYGLYTVLEETKNIHDIIKAKLVLAFIATETIDFIPFDTERSLVLESYEQTDNDFWKMISGN